MLSLRLPLLATAAVLVFGCDTTRRPGGTRSGASRQGTVKPDATANPSGDTGVHNPPGADGGGVTLPDLGFPTNRDSGVTPPPHDAGVDPTTVPVGIACSGNSECNQAAGGTCLFELPNLTFTNGYCTKSCGATDPCPFGAECAILQGTQIGVCGESCSSSGSCRTGYECRSETPRVCWPEEVTPPPPVGSPIGGPCGSASDCRDPGAQCFPDNPPAGQAPFPGGYCWVPNCSQTSPCPTGGQCFQIDDQGNTACLKPCMSTPECGRPEYVCLQNVACFPHCMYATCPAGLTCGADGQCS